MSAIYLHPVQTPVELLLRDCEVRHARRRGPGGQHRNKTESAVVITHTPTGVTAQAAERRSQHDNHRVAVKRLRINLALEVRSPELANAAPTELWQSRCHDGRFGCNSDHEHFAPLLAEALDVVFDHRGQTPGSALQLGTTASQLIKFVKQEPRAFLLVNEWRRQHGLRTLE
ncbi:MAG TPA: peptide chain release factor-like protein [Schlesneria sp.]|jgi:hypothetical protein